MCTGATTESDKFFYSTETHSAATLFSSQQYISLKEVEAVTGYCIERLNLRTPIYSICAFFMR